MQKSSDFETENKQSKARKRIEAIKAFYQHLLAFCLFTPFTIFINYHTYWDYKWFWYSVIPWGIAVAIHGFYVFVYKGNLGSQWEARKIEELMRKEQNKWE